MAIRALIAICIALFSCGCRTFETSTPPVDDYDPDIQSLDIDLEIHDLPGFLEKKVS